MHVAPLPDGCTGGLAMNRRTLLKGLIAGAAGLVLPDTKLVTGEEAQRRYWALDGSMMNREPEILSFIPSEGFRLEAGKQYSYVLRWGPKMLSTGEALFVSQEIGIQEALVLDSDNLVIAKTPASFEALWRGYALETGKLERVDPPRPLESFDGVPLSGGYRIG